MDIEKHLLHDADPSYYLEEIYSSSLFSQHPYKELHKLKLTKQSPKYHPEGNVWNHTMLVVKEAAKRKDKSKNQKAFMWAALLHDIGKPTATRNRKGKITSYDHDKIGAELAKEFLLPFTEDTSFIENVSALIRYHMQILFVVKDLPFADIKGMQKHVDIHEVALLGLCDRLGRGNCNREEEEKNIKIFLEKCKKTELYV